MRLLTTLNYIRSFVVVNRKIQNDAKIVQKTIFVLVFKPFFYADF